MEEINNLVQQCANFGGLVVRATAYEGWNFNSGNYLFTTDTK